MLGRVLHGVTAVSPFLLIGSWPFISFLNSNRVEQNYYGSTVVVWGFTIALGVAGLLLIRLFLPRLALARLSCLLGFAYLLFFSFGAVKHGLILLGFNKPREVVLAWLIVFGAGLAFAWWITRDKKMFAVFVVFGLVLVGVPAAQFLFFQAEVLARAGPGSKAAGVGDERPAATRRPNVYWLVLDGYPRTDVLWEMHKFDNRKFIDKMKDKGFQYISNSYSNYSGTVYSLSTTLNMDYYLDNDTPLFIEYGQPKLEGDNRTWRRFKAIGYSIIHAAMGGGGIGKTFCKGREDVCIIGEADSRLGLDEAQIALSMLTPVHTIARRIDPALLANKKMTVDFLRSWLRKRTPRAPYFFFAHVLSPHGPKRFGDDCAYLDGALRLELVQDPRKDTSSVDVPHDVRCLNPRVISLVDEILSNDRTDPIIIIQGDHGDASATRGYETFEDWLASDGPRFVFGNLNLMRLPAPCKAMVSESMSSVDTFRLIFACLEDRPFEPLPLKLFAEGAVHGFGDEFREILISRQR